MNIGAILPVGTVIHSMLTSAQFSTQYGDNWVIADGRVVTGSLYHSVTGSTQIPDLRGVFLRGKGATYNPDGDLALGTYTASKVGPHAHGVSWTNTGSPSTASGTFVSSGTSSGGGTFTQTTSSAGANETAPASITVNVFIRIN